MYDLTYRPRRLRINPEMRDLVRETTLDQLFSKADMGIGSLGRHRSGITHIKTLKNREYAARGIPFVYSEIDADFDHCNYVLKVPANETPINIHGIDI